MMPNSISNNVWLWGGVLVVFYALCEMLLPSLVFLELLNGCYLGWFVSFFIIYGKQSKVAFQKPPSVQSHFMMGLTLMVIAMAIRMTVSVIFRAVGHIYEFMLHVGDVSEYIAIIGGVLMTTSPGVIDHKIGRRDRRTLYICTAVGIAVAMAAFWIQRVGLIGYVLAKVPVHLCHGLACFTATD